MTKFYELTPGQVEDWANWVETRPKALQEVCKKIKQNVVIKDVDPNNLNEADLPKDTLFKF